MLVKGERTKASKLIVKRKKEKSIKDEIGEEGKKVQKEKSLTFLKGFVLG